MKSFHSVNTIPFEGKIRSFAKGPTGINNSLEVEGEIYGDCYKALCHLLHPSVSDELVCFVAQLIASAAVSPSQEGAFAAIDEIFSPSDLGMFQEILEFCLCGEGVEVAFVAWDDSLVLLRQV